MEEKKFELKNPFTSRLSTEEFQIFQESLIDIVPDIEPEDLNNRKILVRLIDLSISRGKKIFVSKPEDQEKIQQLTANVQELTAKIQELTNELGRTRTLVTLKDDEITGLKGEVDQLTDQVSKPVIVDKLPDYSILLELSERQKTLIEITCSRLSDKLKQTIKPGKFLFHLFWVHYVKQESEPPFQFVIKQKDLQPKQAANE